MINSAVQLFPSSTRTLKSRGQIFIYEIWSEITLWDVFGSEVETRNDVYELVEHIY